MKVEMKSGEVLDLAGAFLLIALAVFVIVVAGKLIGVPF